MHCPNSKGPRPQSWKLSQTKPVKPTKPFPVSLLFQSFSCAVAPSASAISSHFFSFTQSSQSSHTCNYIHFDSELLTLKNFSIMNLWL